MVGRPKNFVFALNIPNRKPAKRGDVSSLVQNLTASLAQTSDDGSQLKRLFNPLSFIISHRVQTVGIVRELPSVGDRCRIDSAPETQLNPGVHKSYRSEYHSFCGQ